MPSLTTEQIDTAADAGTLVRLLVDAGAQVPSHLRERILTFGPSAIAPLIALMEDEELSPETAPGEGWAPIHAVDLLSELRAEAAIEPMLQVMARTDWGAILHDDILQALPKLGPPALEPALAAFYGTNDPDIQRSLLHVLAELKVHDARVYQILAETLEKDSELGAILFAEYGDPGAVPLLSAALDRYQAVPTDDWMANHAVVELQAAIEDLGGVLSPGQQAKVRRILAPAEAQRRRLLAGLERAAGVTGLATSQDRSARPLAATDQAPRATRKIGRNDPCPCGSGKKYKKCCLGKERG